MFLRHPVVAAKPGLCYGRLDLGLGPEASAQIEAALAACPPSDAVVTSPARRCRALAEPLANRFGAGLRVDPGLWELDFGEWEGLTWDQIPRAQSDPWAEDYWNTAPPGGETFRALTDRVATALADVPAHAIVVTHAGVIRAARILLQGVRLAEVWAAPVPHAEPLVIERKAA